jgi:hypothetical protein
MFKKKINGSRFLASLRESNELRQEFRKKMKSKEEFKIIVDGKQYIVREPE